MLVYVAGKYSQTDESSVSGNIERARQVAIELWNQGHTVICPHANSAHMETEVYFGHAEWINRSLILLERCDALVTVPGWEQSIGASQEVEYARNYGIPIYHWDSDDDAVLTFWNLTEERCPKQCRAFMQTLMLMYRTHLSKNSDYSPANILACGEIGLVTRLWDKVARLLNLTGFKFTVSDARFEKPSNPKHESIDDTLLDLSVYGIIGLLLRQGKWGN